MTIKRWWALSTVWMACGTPLPHVHEDPDAQIHTQLTFELTHSKASRFFTFPNKVEGVLALTVQPGERVSGTLALVGTGATSLVAVQGIRDGFKVNLDPASASVSTGGSLEWKRLDLDLRASTEATRRDTGTGSAEGTWTTFGGDVVDSASYTAKVTAAPDVAGAAVTFEPLVREPYLHTFMPSDGLRIRFKEPVLERDATEKIRVLADNQVVAGSFASTGIDGRVVAVEFRPSIFLPFGASLNLDLGGLADPIGNVMAVGSAQAPVAPDPGSLLTNPSFEMGTAGWTVLGKQGGPTGAYLNLAPSAGGQQLVVHEETLVSGYFDVPAGASTLSFSVAFFHPGFAVERNFGGVVKLHRAGAAAEVVFDAADSAESAADCDCEEFGKRIGPERKSVDVASLRGQRVFLSAEARSIPFPGLTNNALVLDDVKVQ